MKDYNNSNSKDIIHQTIGNFSIEMSCTVEYRGNWAPSMTWELHSDGELDRDNSALGYNNELELVQVHTMHVINESVNSTFKNEFNMEQIKNPSNIFHLFDQLFDEWTKTPMIHMNPETYQTILIHGHPPQLISQVVSLTLWVISNFWHGN